MLDTLKPSLEMGPTLISQNLSLSKLPEKYVGTDHGLEHANGDSNGHELPRNISNDYVQHLGNAM